MIAGLSQTSAFTTNNALIVNGGAFTTGGLVSVQGGSGVLAGTAGSGALYSVLEVDSGTANFTAGVTTSAGATGNGGSVIKITGGTVTTTTLTVARSGNGTVTNDATDHELDFSGAGDGLIITGGNTSLSGALAVGSGTTPTGATMLQTNGVVNVAGKVTVHNGAAVANRGSGIRITGGSFTNTDTSAAGGLVLLGATANRTGTNFAMAEFAGGVSSVQKVTIAADSTLNTGVANLYLDGGTLYVGSGGINRTGTGTSLLYTIQLGGSGFAPGANVSEIGGTAVTGFGPGGTQFTGDGILAASAPWSSAVKMTLAGNTTIQLADASAVANNITLSGVLSGTGGLVQTGGGVLTLSGVNTYTGATTLNAGTLNVNGSTAAGSAVTVNGNATLSGNGTVNGPVTLNSGGSVAPGTNGTAGTLHGVDLTWNGGGKLLLDEGASADQLVLTGNLTKGSAGSYGIVFNGTIPQGTTVTLATFGATTLSASDLSLSGTAQTGNVTVNATNIQFAAAWINGPITGNVTDGTNPIVGATVSVVASGTTYSATTIADGSYSIATVPVGTYTVSASATGYVTGNDTGIAVTGSSPAIANFVLSLTPVTGTIAGTVKNNASAVIGNATVSVVVSGTTYTATSSAVDGTYSIANVPAGTGYTVTAVASGTPYGTGTATGVSVTAGNTTTSNFTLTYSSASWNSTGFSASDGVSNLLKYAFAMTAAPSTRSQLPVVSSSGGFLTITYNTQPLAGDLTYSVQGSSDMVTWTAITAPAAATTSPVTVTDTTPLAPGVRRFLRVQVVGP